MPSEVEYTHFGISIHALREEGDYCKIKKMLLYSISIHALREEGDRSQFLVRYLTFYFYPRPPRGGRRLYTISLVEGSYFYPRPPRGGRPGITPEQLDSIIFLSTPSARRATFGETRLYMGGTISIHALREEGDHGLLYRGIC